MKSKVIIVLIISAIATLSFTFSSAEKNSKSTKDVSAKVNNDAPAGGFMSEDKF